MLSDYATWWVEQMVGLVPERLRRPAADGGNAIVIEPVGELETPLAMALTLRRGRQARALGRFPLDGAGIEAARRATDLAGRPASIRLCLPPGLLIEKRITLPLAAERELRRIIAYEMDHETPFSVDEVWWIHTVESRNKAQGKLELRLSLLPRATIADFVGALERANLPPTTIAIPGADGAMRTIDLDVTPELHSRSDRSVPAAAAACVLLAIAAAAFPFARQAIALAAVESRIAELTADVDEVTALRHRLDAVGAEGDVVAASRARAGDLLKVLAATTKILPDDTYLTDFTLHQRKLTLVGQSADAARLIGILARDPAFKDPAFSAPVVRREGTQGDGFSISAEAPP